MISFPLFQVSRTLAYSTCLLLSTLILNAQGHSSDFGRVTGSIQLDAQYYTQDSVIGAPEVPERVLSNTFANILFQKDNFTAGVRFESYQNPLLGIDPRYGTTGDGTGIGLPYRFARFADDNVDITVGNFYEQWGSGMLMRTYEERNLGFDNSIDGLRLKLMPTAGLDITVLSGRQRAFFTLSDGIVRGADLSADLSQISPAFLSSVSQDLQLQFGISAVSRFQKDLDPVYRLPENVFSWSARTRIGWKDLVVDAEYAYKINDPGAVNFMSYNPGNAAYLSLSYAATGFGINMAGKRIDNMDIRSERTAVGNVQNINYLPALTRQHTWRLITLYPYATQPTGEFGLQGDIVFTVPKSLFNDKYETIVTLNASMLYGLDTIHINESRYNAAFLWSNHPRDMYYQDFNLEIQRMFSKTLKATLGLVFVRYNQDIVERHTGPRGFEYGIVSANMAVIELWWQSGRQSSWRFEFQLMKVDYEDSVKARTLQNGDWVMLLIEHAIAPSWYFTIFDEFNFGNDTESLRVHYPNASVAFVRDALRLQAGYGRVRGGILCVGGICRPVPASNGFSLGMTYTL